MPRKPPLTQRVIVEHPLYTTLPIIFGRCVSLFRRDLKLTQAALADAVKMERATLASIESGRSMVGLTQLNRLSRHFYDAACIDGYGDLLALAMMTADVLEEKLSVHIPATNTEVEGYELLDNGRLDRHIEYVIEAMEEENRDARRS